MACMFTVHVARLCNYLYDHHNDAPNLACRAAATLNRPCIQHHMFAWGCACVSPFISMHWWYLSFEATDFTCFTPKSCCSAWPMIMRAIVKRDVCYLVSDGYAWSKVLSYLAFCFACFSIPSQFLLQILRQNHRFDTWHKPAFRSGTSNHLALLCIDSCMSEQHLNAVLEIGMVFE